MADPADITGNGAYDGEARESGITAQVKGYAREAAHAVQNFSHYIRGHDLQTVRADLENQVREHPIITVAIGFGLGFLFGKLVR